VSLDLTKVVVFLIYRDSEATCPNRLYLVQGTDDPVELENVLGEREKLGEDEEGDPIYEEATQHLTNLGYVLTPVKQVLLKEVYESYEAHELDWDVPNEGDVQDE